ncbi:Gibberellin receptor GID1, putative [Ricinus communis]|uniref:Gibberellin receptor GID1, putative n=2 Tax=Ricinus communis TaxID=3988 RepID=B9R7F7_RICCO|nr:Gibberellin receptor GID1, putative [Ricinus communis]
MRKAPIYPSPSSTMDSSNQDVARELPGIVRLYKDGHVERLRDTDYVPPSSNLLPGLSSKDVATTLGPDINISARLYLPKLNHPKQKFPLLVFFHGGAFCISSPFTVKYHSYLTKLVAEANVVAVSVNYRKAPEHPIPVAYEDSWAALNWIVSHCDSNGPEPWLNDHADFGRMFLAGESAGANIAHNMAIAAGDSESGLGIGLLGIALVHPYFWGSDPIGSEGIDPESKASVDRLWPFICPSNPDNDDPRVNPVANDGPSLVGLGCKRVLVSVAEKDVLKERGWLYYQALSRSGWMGVVEIDETEGEGHGFHLYDLECDKAKDLIKGLAAFFNRDMPFL